MAYIDVRAKHGDQNGTSKPEQEIPLNTPWTFWIDRTDSRGLSAADYERNLKKIYTVDSVQKFWQVFNNIPSVAELQANFSYHLMRGQARPIREDPVHRDGGAWRLKCRNQETERIWKELLVAAIGEQLSDPANPAELLGVSVALRDREDMVQLWHGKAAGAAATQLASRVHKALPPADDRFITQFYKAHYGSAQHNGGSQRQRRGS